MLTEVDEDEEVSLNDVVVDVDNVVEGEEEEEDDVFALSIR